MMILEVKNISKSFSSKGNSKIIANDNVTFCIQEGEIFGLLGQNGAGKTRVGNERLGLMRSEQGEIKLLGQSVQESPTRARSICSVQPQSQVPLGFLTPKQAVTIMGKIRAGKAFEPRQVDVLFEALHMEEWANKECETLSGGAQRLTAFCMAVIAPGQLVILDEPTNDVDPIRRRLLWDVIRGLTNDGTSVILVTHNVLEAEKVVDRVAIMHQGKFLTQGTPSEVKGAVSDQLRMELSLSNVSAENRIPNWALFSHRKGARLSFSIDPSDVSATIDWAKEQVDSEQILDYSLSPTTIEDAYIELTSRRAVRQ